MALGERLTVATFALRGHISEDTALALAEGIAKALEMQPAHAPIRYNYPEENGKGGDGFTLIYPIAESFVAVDSYTSLGGGYVIVSSCMPFDFKTVSKTVESAGFEVSHPVWSEARL